MEKLQKPLEPLIQMLPYLENREDLSKCAFEARKAIFDEAYKRLNKEIEDKTGQLQQEETKRSEKRTSFMGKLRHLFGRDKEELKEEARKREEHDKKDASIKGIGNPLSWTWQRREATDGLYYRVGERSVKGKTDEEIELIQEKLRELGIGTQLVTDNDSNDRILLISDPVSKKKIEGRLYGYAQIHDGIDKDDVPLTKEEYAAELEREREREKERDLEEQNEAMNDVFKAYSKDTQLRKVLLRLFYLPQQTFLKIGEQLELREQGKPSIFDMINRPAHVASDNTVVAEGSTHYQSGTLPTHAKLTPGTVAPSEASPDADQVNLRKMLEEKRSKSS